MPTSPEPHHVYQTPQEAEEVLHQHSLIELYYRFEHRLLKFASLLLLLHGFLSIYNELILMFFVFPHLPDLFRDLGFPQSLYQQIFRRSLLISSAAFFETIYGLILLKRHSNLAHHFHIISAFSLLILSFLLAQLGGTLPPESLSYLDTAPTLYNLFPFLKNLPFELFASPLSP